MWKWLLSYPICLRVLRWVEWKLKMISWLVFTLSMFKFEISYLRNENNNRHVMPYSCTGRRKPFLPYIKQRASVILWRYYLAVCCLEHLLMRNSSLESNSTLKFVSLPSAKEGMIPGILISKLSLAWSVAVIWLTKDNDFLDANDTVTTYEAIGMIFFRIIG